MHTPLICGMKNFTYLMCILIFRRAVKPSETVLNQKMDNDDDMLNVSDIDMKDDIFPNSKFPESVQDASKDVKQVKDTFTN